MAMSTCQLLSRLPYNRGAEGPERMAFFMLSCTGRTVKLVNSPVQLTNLRLGLDSCGLPSNPQDPKAASGTTQEGKVVIPSERLRKRRRNVSNRVYTFSATKAHFKSIRWSSTSLRTKYA